MNIKKTIIMWELSLKCNLKCNFCYQKNRRYFQKNQISIKNIKKIIDNLPKNTHIAFIWWESFLYPKFIEVLEYLDNKSITYEITSNWTIVDIFIDKLNKLKWLKNINFSVDFLWKKQDIYRNYNWLFEKISKTIPLLNTNININTIIFPDSKFNEILKLYLYFDKIWINEHTFLMYSSFSKEELINSKKQINSLIIKTNSQELIDYNYLRKKTLHFFKELYNIKKEKKINSKVILIPQSLILNKNSCKHLNNQYRINENWKISICHYIDNEFGDLMNNSFEEVIQNEIYIEIKNKIKNNFPLEICKNCCKIL